MINKIKNCMIIFKNDLKLSITLYSLTLILPTVLTIMLLFVHILGLNHELVYGFWGTFKMLWVDYYITGHLGEVSAWRIQILLFIICYFIVFFQRIKY